MAERIAAGLAIKASAVHDAVHRYAVDSVGTDSYAITPFTTLEAYAAGQMFSFKAGTANTGAASLNVNGKGAKTIKKNVTDDLTTGDILANQIVTVIYDSVADVFQLISKLPTPAPIVTSYSAPATRGGSTTRFDITRPGTPNVNTTRYTYDGTGTDPVISAATFPVGMRIQIRSANFAQDGNNFDGLVTGSGTNWFEVTIATGSGAETDKTLGADGMLIIQQTWTKPAGLRYIEVEVQGAGASGASTRKGGASVFKTVIAEGGLLGGSTATGGDINIAARAGPDKSGGTTFDGRTGGNSVLGSGGPEGQNGTQGGGGGGWPVNNSSGDGGEGGYSGSYARKIFAASALSSTETYFVGVGGLGTDGGADEGSGGNGGDGLIVITEYY